MAGSKSVKHLIRDTVYYGLFSSGLLGLVLKKMAADRREHPCIILTYHRFVDNRSMYLSKGPAMHHEIREFEKELMYLKQHYHIVSIDEAVSRIKRGLGFSRPSVVLTFDDGYLDNYTLAYPVLKRYGMPAAIYLTTGLIGTSERTWPDQIELALLETRQDRFNHPDLFDGKPMAISSKTEKEKVCLDVGQALKALPDEQRRHIVKELVDSLGVNGSTERAPRVMLNWEEVREMAQDGITFGSHSFTHPILSRMPVEKAKEEIFKSKKILEEHLGVEVKHFAFPNGGKNDFSEELREYCREIGFESIASLIPGTNTGVTGDVFSLKRIGTMSPIWLMAGNLARLSAKGNGG
ncbi:MAG: polysaccharide deacetylase domain protein [Deltaproteobacteria bacterium]|nr:polysaccharide deacetylase domain protein [Deltaproteobacteria bacterium]